MSTSQVVPKNQLYFNQFDGVDSHFRTILNTGLYSKLVEEFYLNGVAIDGEIRTKVKGITVTIEPKKVGFLLGFVVDGDTGFSTTDTKKVLDFMGTRRRIQTPRD